MDEEGWRGKSTGEKERGLLAIRRVEDGGTNIAKGDRGNEVPYTIIFSVGKVIIRRGERRSRRSGADYIMDSDLRVVR